MGWTPVNNVSVVREFEPRQIVVRWTDAVTGEHEKIFGFNEAEKAMAFALSEFVLVAM